MNAQKLFLPLAILLCALGTHAQLVVSVAPPKIVGKKTVVPIGFKNDLTEKIESARAACFLLDDQGKMIAQSTKWVIGGGQDKPGLAAGATNAFHFVITSSKPFAMTNLTAKVSLNRVILEGGKLADPVKEVTVTRAKH